MQWRHWGKEYVYLDSLLMSVLHGDEWLSRLGRFTRGKEPRNPPNGRLYGPQSHSGRFGEKKNLAYNGIWTSDFPARSLAALPTTLYYSAKYIQLVAWWTNVDKVVPNFVIRWHAKRKKIATNKLLREILKQKFPSICIQLTSEYFIKQLILL
jgi:hypothetical protein